MKRNIEDYSIDELELLIEQKRKEAKIAPPPLEKPDFRGIIIVVKDYIKDLENDVEPKDIRHYIYESAVEAVYGPDIWDWINTRL